MSGRFTPGALTRSLPGQRSVVEGGGGGGRRNKVMAFEQQTQTYSGLERRKEGNVLFTDALNTFYLRLYGVRHMVKDHSDSEKGNTLPPHRLLSPINRKGSFICTIPQTGQHIPWPLLHQSWSTGWNEKQLSGFGSPHEGSIRRPIAP